MEANRPQDLYWLQLVHLKVACEYLRRYRNGVALWVTRLAILRAIASSSAIAAWAVVRAYPWLWAAIIASAQVADALQQAIPFTRRRQDASDLVAALDRLFIDAQLEWESVFSGRLAGEEIASRRHRLMVLQHDAEIRHFPTGLPSSPKLIALAVGDTAAYVSAVYGSEWTR